LWGGGGWFCLPPPPPTTQLNKIQENLALLRNNQVELDRYKHNLVPHLGKIHSQVRRLVA